MKGDRISKPEVLPEHESAVRRMMADAHKRPYRSLKTLAEAKLEPDGIVVFEGDYGGQIYLVARASQVQCSEELLAQLLGELDARQWNDPEGARMFFEVQPVGQGIAGGMGGGLVADDYWVHPRLAPLRGAIVAVLTGTTKGIEAPRPIT